MAEQVGFRDQYAGALARETPAPRLDPLGEVRRDLAAVLALLEATRAQGMGRKRANRFAHALEAARQAVQRALEATGAGPGPA